MDSRSKLLSAFSVVGIIAGVAMIFLGDAVVAGGGAMLVIAGFVAAMIVVGLYLAESPAVDEPSASQ